MIVNACTKLNLHLSLRGGTTKQSQECENNENTAIASLHYVLWTRFANIMLAMTILVG